MDQHAQTVGFDPKVNKWELIFDFTTKDSGKNYEFLDPSEFSLITKELDGDFAGVPPAHVFPYPARFGGTLSDDAPAQSHAHDDNMMAFSITTSAKAAQ